MTAAVIRIRGRACPDEVEAARLRWVEACRLRDEATERAREALAEWSRLEREASDVRG